MSYTPDMKMLWETAIKGLGTTAADAVIYNREITGKKLVNNIGSWLIVDFVLKDMIKKLVSQIAVSQGDFIVNIGADAVAAYVVDMVLKMPQRALLEYATLAVAGESTGMVLGYMTPSK